MAWHKPGEGPPDHVHFNQEEIFFIVDGLYELTIDGQTSIGGAGTLAFIPRNTVHSFKNVGATPACVLDWTLPGEQDRYFKKISELAAGGSFTGDKLAELNKEHNTTLRRFALWQPRAGWVSGFGYRSACGTYLG
jgi:hypothetical protein